MVGETNLKIFLAMSVFLLAIAGTNFAGEIIYVDIDAQGPTHNGSSWANAYKYLQDGLADANSNADVNEIRVAEGIYNPDANSADPNGSGDRKATFRLINGVAIKGGYAGFGEPDPNARDINIYETILSGDLDGDDNEVISIDEPTRAENSYSVVYGLGNDATAWLDGFTITGGNANRCTRSGPRLGGGMKNYFGSPTLRNCTFTRNSACIGGGMYNRDGSPTLTGCIFSENSARSRGGGMENFYSNPTLTNCTFSANLAEGIGGGMYNGLSSPILTNCTFTVNCADRGGGMCNCSGSPTLTNCMFTANLAEDAGGGMYNIGSRPTLTNCAFVANSAANGSAVACDSRWSRLRLGNCILWDGGGEIWNNDDSVITIIYTDVQGGWPGEGNINVDPCFAQPGYWDPNGTPEDVNDDFWVDGDYHLKSQAGRWDANEGRWAKDGVTSPCIDAGNPVSPIGFEPFPNGGVINIGAYGGTIEASKSYFGEPLCETIVAGDINGDCVVDWRDFVIFASHWLECTAPAPDLVISESDITFSNPHPAEGEEITMTVTVHNIGDVDAGEFVVYLALSCSLDGIIWTIPMPLEWVTVPHLSAGSSTIIYNRNGSFSCCMCEIMVHVDSEGQIQESNEANNRASKLIEIQP